MIALAVAAACSSDDAANSGGGAARAAADAGGHDAGGTGGSAANAGTSGVGGTDGGGSCTPGPTGDALCTDYVLCNGREVCLADGTCGPGTPVPNGTACGQNKSCINGACVDTPIVCGDGLLVSPPEECDDGNLTAGDGCEANCRKTCVSTDPTRNCANPCAFGAVCDDSTSTCLPGTPVPDGVSCGTSTQPDLVCHGGVCTSLGCGNNVLDAGEECDDGNLVAGDGCDNDCRFSCVSSDATRNCALSDPCQGTSACNDTTHTCSAATPLADGTPCGPATEGRLCISGVCTHPVCGNGVVEPTEQCDDGNFIDTDGCKVDCTYTCTQASECADGRICTADVCDAATHTCSNPPDTSVDGQPCSEGGVATGSCANGVCTPPTCGNGAIDPGEMCDLGAQNGQTGSGCNGACQYECSSDAACSDGNLCNGTETCIPVTGGQTCQNGSPLANGSVCADTPHSICMSQTCQVSSCGDGYVDPTATPAEQCEPPSSVTCNGSCQNYVLCDLNGAWAVKVTATVSWNGTAAFANGSGGVTSWSLVTRTQSLATVTDVYRPCGLVLPDFKGSGRALGETYGTIFPDSLFDANTLPTAISTGTFSPTAIAGAAFSSAAVATLIGIDLANPTTATWPSVSTASPVDHDNDGKPGVTVAVKTGSPYSLIPLDLQQSARATELYLATRQVATFGGTLTSCTQQSGAVAITKQDWLFFGCLTSTGSDCTSGQRDFLINNRPQYAMPASGTYTMVKVADDASCATVRGALP